MAHKRKEKTLRFTRHIALAAGLIVTIFAFSIMFRETTDKGRLPIDATIKTTDFSLTSPVLTNNQPIPELYTCKGQNTRPPLAIQNPPANAKSLAIIMRDPDAVNGEWTHWIIWNIDPATTTIDEQQLPNAVVEGINSFSKNNYGGPCPPSGTGVHRYIFELYALDTILTLPTTADRAQLDQAMQGHIIDLTRLTSSFSGD